MAKLEYDIKFEWKPTIQVLLDLADKYPSVVKKSLAYAGRQYQSILTKLRLSGRPGLNRRTGTLARSLVHVATGEALYVGFGASYWKIHEFGGVIRGKPWLAIPLPPMKTRAGVQRMSIQEAKSAHPKAFFRRAKSDPSKLVLLNPVGDGSLQALFVLQKSVRIPARLEAGDTFFQVAPSKFEERLAQEVDEAIKRSRSRVSA